MLDDGARRALGATRFAALRWVETIESTNAALLADARAGAPEGAVLVADHQSAGRGRLGRRWEAPPGSSLLVSVLLRPPLGVEHAHLTTVATALAASDAVDELVGFRPRLKWPNDLVVDDRKLAGILAEAVVTGPRLDAVVVGMGLNVNWPEPFSEEATACNLVAGHDVDRAALLVRFLERLDEHYGALREAGGRQLVVAAARRLSATLGRRVRVELPAGEVIEGRAVDITADGNLLVEATPGRLRRIAVGDVVHLRPA